MLKVIKFYSSNISLESFQTSSVTGREC